MIEYTADAAAKRLGWFLAGILALVVIIVLAGMAGSGVEGERCDVLRHKARAVYVCANTRGCAVQQDDLETLYANGDWFQQNCRKETP